MKACFRFDWVGLSLPPSATDVCVLERSLKVMFQTEALTCLNLYDPYCCLWTLDQLKVLQRQDWWGWAAVLLPYQIPCLCWILGKQNCEQASIKTELWKVVVELASSNSWRKLQFLFLRSIYRCYNCIPNNICLFLILRFFLPSVIPLKEILVKKWTSYSQRIWHWQNEALPYVIRKHNCSMSKKKSLLFVLEHVFSFFFLFFFLSPVC